MASRPGVYYDGLTGLYEAFLESSEASDVELGKFATLAEGEEAVSRARYGKAHRAAPTLRLATPDLSPAAGAVTKKEFRRWKPGKLGYKGVSAQRENQDGKRSFSAMIMGVYLGSFPSAEAAARAWDAEAKALGATEDQLNFPHGLPRPRKQSPTKPLNPPGFEDAETPRFAPSGSAALQTDVTPDEAAPPPRRAPRQE